VYTEVQKDFVDQGGTVQPRDRFAGGGNRNPERLIGAIKAVDPVTGETKVRIRLDYPNFGGIMATAGNLIFAGHLDGHVLGL